MSSIVHIPRSRIVDRLTRVLRRDFATPLEGTVTVDGTINVVGSGTEFTTDYAVGSMIRIYGERRLYVATIADNTTLTLTAAAAGSASGLAHSNGQGLFERFDGVIGNGDEDEPEIEPRIEAWPVETIPPEVRPDSIIVQAVRPSGVFEATPSKRNMPLYEIMVTLFLRSEPKRLVAGALNADDVFIHIRDVVTRGEHPSVPGILFDPDAPDDDPDRHLVVGLANMNEETVQRFKDVTLYPLRLGYFCRENIMTGELA